METHKELQDPMARMNSMHGERKRKEDTPRRFKQYSV